MFLRSPKKSEAFEKFVQENKTDYDKMYEIAQRVQNWEEYTEEEFAFAKTVCEKMVELGAGDGVQRLSGLGRNPNTMTF